MKSYKTWLMQPYVCSPLSVVTNQSGEKEAGSESKTREQVALEAELQV